MGFLDAMSVTKRIWEKKNHHHLYNMALEIYEEANTKLVVFDTVWGKRIDKKNKPILDSLIHLVRRCSKSLQHNSTLASTPAVRAKIGERDFNSIIQLEKEVKKRLKEKIKMQANLQRQIDAESYFQKQEDNRAVQTVTEKNHPQTDYLKTKPLPPLRKSVVSFTSGLRSRVTIMPAEKDIEVWLMLEDEDLNPIIDSYSSSKPAFEQDGFMTSPTNKKTWI